MGPNSDAGKGTLYINGEPISEVDEIKISMEVEPSDFPPNPDRCFLYRYDGLPPVVAVEIGVVDFQSPVEGAGCGNPSKVGVEVAILNRC